MFTRLCLLFVPLLCTAALHAEMAPGDILVARVSGDAYFQENPEGPQKVLMKGYKLSPDNVVITKIQSKAVLLFSSGSTLLVKPESRVHIQEYLDQRKDSSIGGELPDVTKAQLRLIEGDVVGSVKKLGANDSFVIHALSYSAGIRGTDWWMKLRKSERFEMTRVPKAGGGRAYKTTPIGTAIAWGFGVAEGSAMLTGPGGLEMPVGNQTVVNVEGMLSPEDTIEGAEMAPDTMPAKQFEAITGAASMMKDMMDEAQ